MARYDKHDVWDLPQPETPAAETPDPGTVDPAPEIPITHAPAGSVREWLEREKFVEVESKVLGETVYFGYKNAKVDGVFYLPDELDILAEGKPEEETLRTIHELKRVFGGTLVREGL